MNAYTIHYKNGTSETAIARSALEVVKKYDLATRENIGTEFEQLEGEEKQKAITAWGQQFGNA